MIILIHWRCPDLLFICCNIINNTLFIKQNKTMSLPAREKIKVQKLVSQIEQGSFDDNVVDSLFMKLRGFSHGNVVFREIADFVAHNDKRNKGITVEALNALYLSMKYFIEYVSPNKAINIQQPFPIYIKRLMIYQVNKCDEHLLREKFHESKLSLKNRIDTSFKEDKEHGIAYFKKDRISRQFFESIQYLLGFIGVVPAFTQQALIEQLIAVLSKNGISFNEDKIREQEKKIVLCILCLLNNTQFEYKGHKPGYCKVSCERKEIMNIPNFVDQEGNKIDYIKSFGNLSLEGYIVLKNEDKDLTVCYPLFATDLSVEEWCDEDLFTIRVQGAGNSKVEFHKVNLDTDLVISENFKLSSICT